LRSVSLLKRIQHRANLRMSDICGAYPERLEQLDLSLEDRETRGDAVETYKYIQPLEY